MRHSRRHLQWLGGLALLWLIVPQISIAQVQVDFKLDRKTYVAHEPISGELLIINRAGRDLVFGNVNGRNWLDYNVTDGRGNLVSPIRRQAAAPPVVIASGQAHKIRVVVNKIYPMGQIGTYRVGATVSFPQINRVFQSRTSVVQVAEGKPIPGSSQIVGVPAGYPGAGTYRVYDLLTYYHGSRQKALYFRLKSNSTGRVLKCFSLGDYLTVRPPTFKIDRENMLHIVHMVAPKQFFYTVIDLTGQVVTREKYFEHKGSRPGLVKTDFGDVELRGGVTEEEARTPYERKEFRKITERPPGMPKI